LLAINLSRIGKKVPLQPFAFSWGPKVQAKAV